VRSRQIFLLGAAALATVAALGAVVAVFTGHFEALATIFVLALAAPFALVDVDFAPFVPTGAAGRLLLGFALAACGSLIWAEQIQPDANAYWKFLAVLLAFAIATLAVTTNRSLLRTPKLVRTVFPATAVAAYGAAAILTAMIVADDAGPWKLLTVLVILAVLGEVLAPILESYVAAGE
jgi:hypothetical protein